MSVDNAVLARTMLFVPGDRPERFVKAANSGAGLVVLDLEDSVRVADRVTARDNVRAALKDGTALGVRINAVGSADHEADLETIAGVRAVVMLAKAESADQVEAVASRLAHGSRVVALVESAQGVLAAAEFAAHPAVGRLAFGSLDYAVRLGVSPDDRDALLAARGEIVLGSAAANIAPPVDGVTTRFDDEALLQDEVGYARRLGFGGKLCIHPRQVAPSEAGLAPTSNELRWAEQICAAAEDGCMVVVDGAMVDKPVVDRARRLLGLDCGDRE